MIRYDVLRYRVALGLFRRLARSFLCRELWNNKEDDDEGEEEEEEESG